MPKLTPEAARFLEDVIERSGRDDAVFRVERSARGFALQLDREQEGDELLESDGQVLLVMAEEVAEKLGDAVIDVREETSELVISRERE